VIRRVSDTEVISLSAVCTHQGCTVDLPSEGRIVCGCHGSQFDAATGAVLNGPASQKLELFPSRVEKTTILIEA